MSTPRRDVGQIQREARQLHKRVEQYQKILDLWPQQPTDPAGWSDNWEGWE